MKRKSKNGKHSFIKRLFAVIVVIVFIAGFVFAYQVWRTAFSPNVNIEGAAASYFYLPSGSDYDDLLGLLNEQGILDNKESFSRLADIKNLPSHIYPGRYRIEDGMSNNSLINLLRSGTQSPVNLVFNQTRSLEELASVVSRQIEADSAGLIKLFRDDSLAREMGFSTETLPAIFLPNTYEFYWNTSAVSFIERMNREYERFWSERRENLREETGLTREEVVTLASIVAEETNMTNEMPVIAGVYINRLNRGMRLQADPTIKFIIDDFAVNRVLSVHLKVDSPYNTYIYGGLPPGPIIIPSIDAIEAVLSFERHDYFYFSAKEDFSGYHRFARTLSEHNRNARLYREALDERRIYR